MDVPKRSSNREQARIYNIHESVIRRWRKDHTEARIKEAMNSPEKMTKNRLPGMIRFSFLNFINWNIRSSAVPSTGNWLRVRWDFLLEV